MAHAQSNVAAEIERYIRTGGSDPYHAAWSGGFLERANWAHEDLRAALIRETLRLAGAATHQLIEGDGVVLTRGKVGPMVRGFFPRAEQAQVLAMLEKSVIFLTRETIEPILLDHSFDGSAWTLANLYLASLGAELLGEGAPKLVGMSEGTTCYVSPEYFTWDDPFADFIVHEAAHIFHNCKRRTVGLRQTRAKGLAERSSLAEEYGKTVHIPDNRVDPTEVVSIVKAAATKRNGWKVILARCAPT